MAYCQQVSEVFLENLWPTRCAICDKPGVLLCKHCRINLPYINYWLTCKRCGAPYGIKQCTECNTTVLEKMGRKHLSYVSSVACVEYNDISSRIVRCWKDQGERRLGEMMAQQMAQVIPPAWLACAPSIVPIPASKHAYRKRGFDHIEELCEQLSMATRLPILHLFERPKTHDQRALGRTERQANMKGRFVLLPRADIPSVVLLVDDVQTTGATLNAAADALVEHAPKSVVYALTYARV